MKRARGLIATKVKNFVKRAGEAAGESGNFHKTNVGLLAKVKIFLRRVEAGGSLLKKRECTLKIDGVVGKVKMHVKN